MRACTSAAPHHPFVTCNQRLEFLFLLNSIQGALALSNFVFEAKHPKKSPSRHSTEWLDRRIRHYVNVEKQRLKGTFTGPRFNIEDIGSESTKSRGLRHATYRTFTSRPQNAVRVNVTAPYRELKCPTRSRLRSMWCTSLKPNGTVRKFTTQRLEAIWSDLCPAKKDLV